MSHAHRTQGVGYRKVAICEENVLRAFGRFLTCRGVRRGRGRASPRPRIRGRRRPAGRSRGASRGRGRAAGRRGSRRWPRPVIVGFVARTISSTSPFAARSSRPAMRRSEGSTPSIGESAPPRTWYRPRNSAVRSSERTSTGCSTTQITERSRRGSAQIGQSSSSVRFPHSRQKRTRLFTSSIARASSSASSGRAERRWKVSRCAVRRPIPGSFVSCVTRFSTAGLSTEEASRPFRTGSGFSLTPE